MQNEVTIWALNAAEKITPDSGSSIYKYLYGPVNFSVRLVDDSLWIVTDWDDESYVAFRNAFAPGGLTIDKVKERDNGTKISLTGSSGNFTVDIDFPPGEHQLLHYTVQFKPSGRLSIPFWPKDILVLSKEGEPLDSKGELFVKQIGIRSGLVYAGIKDPGKGSFLYFQNLTAINNYCSETETSVGNTVTGQWPEFGFSVPVTKDKPLPGGKEIILSDAYVSISTQTPADQFEIATGYIDHLAAIYRLIPRPETKYQDYSTIIKYSIHDIEKNKGCWS
jgi:hypothetical protein